MALVIRKNRIKYNFRKGDVNFRWIFQFGKVSYFVNLLGKDEVRSIASLSLVEFVMSYPGGVPDEEVPALIKQAVKCDLINSVHRLEYRRGKEEAPPTNADTGSPENSSGDTGSPSAPPYGEPEACLLQNADAQTVQDAIQHLNRNEQTVIQFAVCCDIPVPM